MATIEERLKKIIKDQFGIEDDEFVPRARLYESFRADTVDLVEISWAIAEEFHLKFIDVDISRLLTIGDLLDFLKEHLLRRVRICYELLMNEESEEKIQTGRLACTPIWLKTFGTPWGMNVRHEVARLYLTVYSEVQITSLLLLSDKLLVGEYPHLSLINHVSEWGTILH